MKDLLKNHPLQLLVLLPEPESDAGLKKLQLLAAWSPWLAGLNLHMILCIRPAKTAAGVLQAYFPLPVRLDPLPLEQRAASLGCKVEKPVFGTLKRFIPACLILFDQERKVFETRRINPSSIRQLVHHALKIQTAWLQEQIGSQIDTILDH